MHTDAQTKGDTVEFRHESRVSLDFYNQLDAYLKGERKKLKEVFAQVRRPLPPCIPFPYARHASVT